MRAFSQTVISTLVTGLRSSVGTGSVHRIVFVTGIARWFRWRFGRLAFRIERQGAVDSGQPIRFLACYAGEVPAAM
jgi:hypothetical protein